MSKEPLFKRDDRVKITRSSGFSKGSKGVVKRVTLMGWRGGAPDDAKVVYWVLRDGASSEVFFFEHELSFDDELVHKSHCCDKHGCKYGEDDCPVVSGKITQDFDCEECEEERLRGNLETRICRLEEEIKSLRREPPSEKVGFLRKFKNIFGAE